MSSYASKKYDKIITCDTDHDNILRTPAPFLEEKDWAIAHETAAQLLFVRNTILKGGAGLAAAQSSEKPAPKQ